MTIESIDYQISAIVEKFGTSNLALDRFADLLKQLASERNFWMETFKIAEQNEELLYEISIHKKSGISLYLVSDSLKVKSLPHIHHTWAIIAGISGTELNRIYSVTDQKTQVVKEVKSILISSGDVVRLAEDDIHSTEVLGSQSTYHLHLYGCDLKSLPAFDERTFMVESK